MEKFMVVEMNNPKLIVMYYGRFQPPHIGHIGVYQKIASVFGKSNVYVGTSDKTDREKSPLSFQWKSKLLTAMGVPANRIVQTKRNYNADEVQSSLGVDPSNSVFIVAIGQKDAGRLKKAKYFDQYKKGGELEPMSEKAYYYIIPNVKMGGKVMSATDVRKILRKDELTKNDYAYLKQAIGATKASVGNLKKLFESYEKEASMLSEGAMGGHMNNLYDDHSLTFSELETIISDSLSGELNKSEMTEKVDGQNLFASVINGKVRLSRNKSQTKNKGAGAMSIKDIVAKWPNTPTVRDAFIQAFKALDVAFKQFSEKELVDIFDNGSNWVNMEIISPSNPNVFHYGTPQVVFHGLEMVDDSGAKIGVNQKLTSKLYKKIDSITPGDTPVKTPPFVKLKQHEDFSKKTKHFIAKLGKFRSLQKVGKGASLGQWYEKYFNKKLTAIESKLKSKIDPKLKKKIIHRLAWNDKSLKMTTVRKELGDAFLYGEISKLAKGIEEEYKTAREPLVLLLMELGTEVLKNLEHYLSASPEETVNTLRKDIASKISQVSGSKNPDDMKKMRAIIKRIDSVGGMNKIVPTEGIVFGYNGKTYKITGTFAPLTQLLGIGKFGK